jgi:hypothetical protein
MIIRSENAQCDAGAHRRTEAIRQRLLRDTKIRETGVRAPFCGGLTTDRRCAF